MGSETRKIKAAALSVFLLLGLAEARAQEAAEAPERSLALAGMWRVNGVRLNETLMRRLYYNYDDVRLIGRLLIFSKERIETDTLRTHLAKHLKLNWQPLQPTDWSQVLWEDP